MTNLTITEPHPTVAKNSYTHSGRGGAGNFFRAPAVSASSGIPSKIVPVASSTTTRFYSGRGGAGNARAAAERPVLNFDEEFNRAEIREKAATITHVGRGGAGNVFSTDALTTSSKKDRRDSTSTGGSIRSGFWSRLSNIGSHH